MAFNNWQSITLRSKGKLVADMLQVLKVVDNVFVTKLVTQRFLVQHAWLVVSRLLGIDFDTCRYEKFPADHRFLDIWDNDLPF